MQSTTVLVHWYKSNVFIRRDHFVFVLKIIRYQYDFMLNTYCIKMV